MLIHQVVGGLLLGLVVLVVAAATHMAWCTPMVMLGLFAVLLGTSLSVMDRDRMIHIPSIAEAYQGCGMALGASGCASGGCGQLHCRCWRCTTRRGLFHPLTHTPRLRHTGLCFSGLAIGGFLTRVQACVPGTVGVVRGLVALGGLLACVWLEFVHLAAKHKQQQPDGRRGLPAVIGGILLTAVAQLWCCWVVPCWVARW